MKTAIYRTVLTRVGTFSGQIFGRSGSETAASEMRSIRCSSMISRAKKGNGRVQPTTKKKLKNTVYTPLNGKSVPKQLIKPTVVSTEEDRLEDSQKNITELKTLPGVGRKNAELLSKKGLNVEALRNMFFDRFEEKDSKFVDYLQDEVGIIHRCHCRSIAGYLSSKDKGNSENKNQEEDRRITFSIEGNISAGKTSFLSYLSEQRCEIQDLCEFVREPVDMWQKVGGNEGNNLLQRFYNEPEKHAYEFQNYVFLTRLKQNRNTFEGDKPLRIMERSVFSDRVVFVRAVHEAEWMDDMQLQLYDSWFNPLIKDVPGLIPDGFIYLRANPDTCLRRLKRRARSEELTVTKGYLQGLHDKHEDWFMQNKCTKNTSPLFHQSTPGIDRITARLHSSFLEAPLPPELEDCIVWLGIGNKGIPSKNGVNVRSNGRPMDFLPEEVKAAMYSVPALVLDYDEDFDLEHDEEAKKHYSKKVKAYFDYVKLHRKTRSPFYLTKDSECLRMKWDLVDSFSRELLYELRDKGLETGSSVRELVLPGR